MVPVLVAFLSLATTGIFHTILGTALPACITSGLIPAHSPLKLFEVRGGQIVHGHIIVGKDHRLKLIEVAL